MAGVPSQIDAQKLGAVEELFSGSELGRAFLEGLGKGQRDEDLVRIFRSLEKLETHTGAIRDEARIEALRDELKSMSEAILQTRGEIAAIKPESDSSSRIMAATEELDAITTATERATSDILGAAERIQAAAQGMREGGIDKRICELLDNQANNIFMACSFQDITGQRVQKVVNLLRYLEQRINAMVGLWVTDQHKENTGSIQDLQFNPLDTRADAHLMSGPSRDGAGVSQDDVDRMLHEAEGEASQEPVAEIKAEAAPEPEPVAEAAPEAAPEPSPEPSPEPAPEEVAETPAEEAAAATTGPVEKEISVDAPAKENVDQDDIDAMFG